MSNFAKSVVLSLLSILSVNMASAQSDELIYEDEVYVDYIKSVTFHQFGLPTSYPIIELNRGTMQLAFDDMGGSFYDYTYHIIHCDKDWNPSNINEIEYLDGFNGELLLDYTTSENTFVDYTRYQLRFPNKDVQLKISGNYLLVINDDEDLPVISKRFMVIKPKVVVMGQAKKSPEVEFIDSYQAIDLKINTKEEFPLVSPTEELYVSILQNGRWDNSLRNIRPTTQIGKMIRFDKVGLYSFPGQKEFRKFDIRSLTNNSEYVHSIDLNPDGTVALLEIQKSRAYRNYLNEADANGAFVIDNFDALQPEITGDYVNVHFTLNTSEIYDKEVYMVGRFSDWKPRNEFKLEWDNERGVYKGNALFKQGYYDYYYASVGRDQQIDTEELEGNWFETANVYIVLVYQRAFGENYDELIGISYVNSLNMN